MEAHMDNPLELVITVGDQRGLPKGPSLLGVAQCKGPLEGHIFPLVYLYTPVVPCLQMDNPECIG